MLEQRFKRFQRWLFLKLLFFYVYLKIMFLRIEKHKKQIASIIENKQKQIISLLYNGEVRHEE